LIQNLVRRIQVEVVALLWLGRIIVVLLLLLLLQFSLIEVAVRFHHLLMVMVKVVPLY